jgi:Methyladenine glycosylase
MTRAVFQAGVKWQQIAEHWHAYRQAFADFDPRQVALFGALDAERVLATPGVLRMPRKVHATIRNAATLVEADRQFDGVANYLRGFDGYSALARDMKKRFSFMGDMNVWYFLFRVGEPVPAFEQWVKTIPGDHPRMRDMVERARGEGRSPEV